MLTMAIGGLWHGGDNWNYLIWGIIHGSALCCDRAFTQRGWSMPNFASRSLTLLAVMFAWTIFRAAGFDNALDMWAGQLGLNGMSIGDEIILALPRYFADLCDRSDLRGLSCDPDSETGRSRYYELEYGLACTYLCLCSDRTGRAKGNSIFVLPVLRGKHERIFFL
jgi:hypothetical protein